jgi:hypothetical protein
LTTSPARVTIHHMRVAVVVCLGLLAALHGCSSSPGDVARSTTTTSSSTPPAASPTTTTTAAANAETTAAPQPPFRRHVPMRVRAPRPPRITRQTTRAHLEKELGARRPGYAYAPADLDWLTTKAMQIRVARQRLTRMRPEALETPRAAATRTRIDAMVAEFAAKAGVPADQVLQILAMPTPAPGPAAPLR